MLILMLLLVVTLMPRLFGVDVALRACSGLVDADNMITSFFRDNLYLNRETI